MIKFTQKVADDTSAAFSFFDFQTYVDRMAQNEAQTMNPETAASDIDCPDDCVPGRRKLLFGMIPDCPAGCILATKKKC